MAKTLFILNDPPYGTERSYNARRLAGSLARRPGEEAAARAWTHAASPIANSSTEPGGVR